MHNTQDVSTSQDGGVVYHIEAEVEFLPEQWAVVPLSPEIGLDAARRSVQYLAMRMPEVRDLRIVPRCDL